MKPTRILLLLTLFLTPALLAGCGIRGNPSQPGPARNVTYPHPYPPA